ncbi:structure-specific endonuclease subunit EME2 isoform X4 [Urocitellus parryii]
MAAAGPDRAGRSIWAGPALKGARRTPSHPLHPLGTQRCPERPAPQFRGGPAPPSHTHTRPNAQRPKPRIQTVLEDTGADVLMEALGALGCECRIEPQRRARSLRWSGVRHDPGSTEGPPCPVPWISPESPAHPHLAVIGLDAHLWSCQPSAQGMQQLQNSEVVQAKEVVSWPEVEEALVLLQLHADLDVLLVASWQELTQHVCAYTKALAQLPSKQCWDSQAFSFCTAGRWAAGQQVARDGSGLRGVWWRQIRQFNRVSPAVADAIVTAFPSPRLLQQALMACSTEQERLGLLADLPVEASKGRQSRRVGPDLSRRICLFLTTTSPDLLLDLGS